MVLTMLKQEKVSKSEIFTGLAAGVEDIPDINNPKTMKAVLEGDKLIKEVLNGGYNVHPVPPPNSEIKERITKRYERERIKIEKLFTLGYTTSGSVSALMSSTNFGRERFHKDNLRHLSRFPDFFVFKRILSAKIWKRTKRK